MPYIDNFDARKNYVKVLFKPRNPLQAGELNELQSIFHAQIKRFADHVYKNGSKISNARMSLILHRILRIEANPIIRTFREGMTFKGLISEQTGRFIDLAFVEDTGIIFEYVGGNKDGVESFIAGEPIQVFNSDGIKVADLVVQNRPSFFLLAPCFYVDEGVFYYNGYFIETPRQKLLLGGGLYDGVIGFNVDELIVTPEEDPTLLDNNVLGASYQQEGADRLQYKLTLCAFEGDIELSGIPKSKDFITLVEVVKGEYNYMKTDSEYAQLGDFIAQRTYEESGNYTVQGFDLKLYEHKQQTPQDDLGYDLNGSEDNYVVGVGPGIAYVKGYRVEKGATTHIIAAKSRDVGTKSGCVSALSKRTSFLAIPVATGNIWGGNPTGTNLQGVVDLYDGPISAGTGLPTGTKIGSMVVLDAEFYGTTTVLGAEKNIYRYYLGDLTLAAGKNINSIKCLYSAGASFAAQPHMIGGVNVLENAGKHALIWELGDYLSSIRNADDPTLGSVTIFARKKYSIKLDSGADAVLNAPNGESFLNNGKSIFLLYDTTTKTLALTTSQVTISSNQVIFTNIPDGAGKTIIAIMDIVVSGQSEKTKQVTDFTQELGLASSFTTANLTKSDLLLSTVKVELYEPAKTSPVTPEVVLADITNICSITDGVEDYAYIAANVTKVGNYAVAPTVTAKVRVIGKYFKHIGDQGFFSVDSYSSYDYEDIPEYTSKKTGEVFKLRNCIDFRPLLVGTNLVQNYVPAPDQTIIYDARIYLPRIDYIVADSSGAIKLVQGDVLEKPIERKFPDEQMLMYTLHLKPYLFSLKDITVKKTDNRRYTMKDIGRIEKKVSAIEYHTSLKLLEKSALEMSIKDANGLDRFKNGFIVDNFKDFQAADTNSNEFKAAISVKNEELSPRKTLRSARLKLREDLSSGYQIKNGMAMLPFDHILEKEQLAASRPVSINPFFMISIRGNLKLTPNMDMWADVTRTPAVTVNVDTSAATAALQTISDFYGVNNREGAWAETNRTLVDSEVTSTNVANSTQTSRAVSVGATGTTTTTTNTSIQTTTRNITDTFAVTQERVTNGFDIGSRTNTYNTGERLTDANIQPYMRAMDITFTAMNLMPNTRVYAFFAEQPVTQYCRQTGKGPSNPGGPLIVDATGQIEGVFSVPAGTFFTGTNKFVLTGDINNSGDAELEFTKAGAKFFAGGLSTTSAETNLNVATPTFNPWTRVDSQTNNVEIQRVDVSSVVTGQSSTSQFVPRPPPQARMGGGGGRYSPDRRDPIAQSVRLEKDCFVTALEVYFSHVDLVNQAVDIELRTMSNGYPTKESLAMRNYLTPQIQPYISADASVPFRVEWNTPVFVKGGTEFCFVLGGWSQGTRAWVARLGDPLIDDPTKIHDVNSKTGDLGTCFRSQNGITWTAEQFDDIKYKLYTADFKTDTMNLVYNLEDISVQKLVTDPLETEDGMNRMRIYIEDHGLKVDDKVRLSINNHEIHTVDIVGGGLPYVGQEITTNSGHGVIESVEHKGGIRYDLGVRDLVGALEIGESVTIKSKSVPGQPKLTGEPGDTTIYLERLGTVVMGPTSTLNGLSVRLLNTYHIVAEVDSCDSVIIELKEIPNLTGRWGGHNCYAETNYHFELFNISGLYDTYGGNEEAVFSGTLHSNYAKAEPKTVTLKSDHYVTESLKYVSKENAATHNATTGTFRHTLKQRAVDGDRTSPVVNMDSMSMILVSNQVGNETPEQLNVEPNALGRFVAETDPLSGTSAYKYVTKTIKLGKPATDFRIMVDVVREAEADFDIFVKTTTAYSTLELDRMNWVKISGYDKPLSSNGGNFKELEISSNECVANDTTDPLLDGDFSEVKFKIVGKTSDPAKAPRFKNLRIIAYT